MSFPDDDHATLDLVLGQTHHLLGEDGDVHAQRLVQAAVLRVRRDHRVTEDSKITLAEYLPAWLAEREHQLKASTLLNYGRYVELDLVPALGTIPLQQLHHDHIRMFVTDLVEAGRGPTTIRRILATLSSALADAGEQRRLLHNPATHVTLPKIDKTERVPWTAEQAVTFLDHVTDDRLGPLFELLVGCGLRRGEALALR